MGGSRAERESAKRHRAGRLAARVLSARSGAPSAPAAHPRRASFRVCRVGFGAQRQAERREPVADRRDWGFSEIRLAQKLAPRELSRRLALRKRGEVLDAQEVQRARVIEPVVPVGP